MRGSTDITGLSASDIENMSEVFEGQNPYFTDDYKRKAGQYATGLINKDVPYGTLIPNHITPEGREKFLGIF